MTSFVWLLLLKLLNWCMKLFTFSVVPSMSYFSIITKNFVTKASPTILTPLKLPRPPSLNLEHQQLGLSLIKTLSLFNPTHLIMF